MSNSEKKISNKKLTPSSPHAWVTSTYFAEGFPYTLVNTIAEALFTEFGASLKVIGLTSIFHLPWNLKFLWGPYLDEYACKRRWLLWTELFLFITILGLALSVTLPDVVVLSVASVFFLLMAFLSATHDIAIDGYYLEALDKTDQSRFVGYRVAAYRVAMLVAGGLLLIIVKYFGWFLTFLIAGFIFASIALYHYFYLPKIEQEKKSFKQLARDLFKPRSLKWFFLCVALIIAIKILISSDAFSTWFTNVAALKQGSFSDWIGISLLAAMIGLFLLRNKLKEKLFGADSFYAKAFLDFLEQPRVFYALAFIILFRVGESFLLKMRYPFLKSIGMSISEIGFATGVLGLFASVGAAILGGFLIARHGLKFWIWPFVIVQNALNLLYMWLAGHHAAIGGADVAKWIVNSVITIEAAGAGFGTAVFTVYIMRCCRPNYKAAHMAIVTALMSVGFTIAGISSGFIAETTGFTQYFFVTFLATIPAMVLIFKIPHLTIQPRNS